jgi:hypothetical protein
VRFGDVTRHGSGGASPYPSRRGVTASTTILPQAEGSACDSLSAAQWVIFANLRVQSLLMGSECQLAIEFVQRKLVFLD